MRYHTDLKESPARFPKPEPLTLDQLDVFSNVSETATLRGGPSESQEWPRCPHNLHITQMAHEPAGCEPGDLLQRPRLLEKVRRPGHDPKLLLRLHLRKSFFVHADHGQVVAADNKERGRLDEGQGVAR